MLGANNVADQTGQDGALDVDLEQIGAWNPDYMFLNAGNIDLLKADYAVVWAFLWFLGLFEK